MRTELRVTPTQADAVRQYLADGQRCLAVLEGDCLRIPDGCEAWALQRMDEALERMEANDPEFSGIDQSDSFCQYWAVRRLRQAIGQMMAWHTAHGATGRGVAEPQH